MSKVLALEEVGKCYEAIPIYYPTIYPTIDGKPNKEIQRYEPLSYCVFAWRLQPSDKVGEYVLNTTAGIPNDSDGAVLHDANGRLLFAHGPFHNGNENKPEWLIDKASYDNHDDENWEIIAYGVLTTTKKIYHNKNIICKVGMVKAGVASNYAEGCYTYNYSVSSPHRWGYIGRPGFSKGGPIISKKPAAATSDLFLNTPSCATVDPDIVHILIPGESCGKSGFFEMENSGGLETKQKPKEESYGDSSANLKLKSKHKDLYEEY